jgi:formylglycine-generating enzyme required for sulfatase activity
MIVSNAMIENEKTGEGKLLPAKDDKVEGAMGRDSQNGPLQPELAPWAVAQGVDAYGRWAEIDLAGQRAKLRWIEPGTFLMGSPESEVGRCDNEGPQHTVTITEGFWLGETPVTQAQWEAVMGNNPSHFKGASKPVENVSWNECEGFFARVKQLKDVHSLRFPTEAEWEYACRAETTTATWVGDLTNSDKKMVRAPELDAIAWYAKNSRGKTHDVREKSPNPWGLHDMLGNVWEWCGDWLTAYTTDAVSNPGGATSGSYRVFRGSSWNQNFKLIRAASRLANHPGARREVLGFRLARGQH